jgi:hypothetical protein
LVTGAAGEDIETVLESSIATITASRTKALTPDVKTRMNWVDVEEIIEGLYMEKKDSLRVEWNVKYKTKSMLPPPPAVETPGQRHATPSTVSAQNSTTCRRVC